MEENVNLNQPTETKFSILWFFYFIFFTIVFIILRLFSAIQTKEIIDFVDCFITFFAAVGLGLFVFNKSPESYGGHFWKIFALVFPVYDISKNILIDPILRHRGLLTFELFLVFLLIMPIYTALFIFSFRNSSSLTMVNLCNKKARLSLIYFLLFVIFLTTNIFINMHLDAISSVALKEERKLTTANYHYLNSLPVDEAHSLTVVEEHPKDFYVYAMKVVDLYHDNNKELVYKKDDNLYIVDKQWNILHQCFAGVEANGNGKILIEDINMDGVPEIITTGANKESTLNEISLRVGAGAYSTIISYVNKSRVRIQFFSRYEPERIKTTIEELSKIVSIEKINENEIFLNKSDYEKISNTHYSLKIFDNRCNLINQYSISPANLGTSLLFSVENSSSSKILLLKTVFDNPHNFFLVKDNTLNFTEEKVYSDLIKSKEVEEKYPLGEEKTRKFKVGANAILVDLNNDGQKEVIVKSIDEKYLYPSPTTVFVLDSTNGNVLAKYVYQSWINSIAVGDFYGDGKNEIILSGHSNQPFSVLRFR